MVHFLRVEQAEGFIGICILWATWAQEYMAIFVKIDRQRTSGRIFKLCDWFSANNTDKALFRFGCQTNNDGLTRRGLAASSQVKLCGLIWGH